MQVFRTLAGYSLGRADIVRRAMSKKKKDVMEREHKIFINGLVSEDGTVEVEGCIRRGVDEATAKSVYADMESFASYAFNKSHAAAYATVAYQTAFLKYHYPCEYFAALMTTVLDNGNKLAGYIAECRRLGIEVLPPHVNASCGGFTVCGDKSIRFGLLAVRNLGKSLIDAIVTERENGQFSTFYNFCKRLSRKGMNIRALESLIRCGALDGLDANRRQMAMSAKPVMDGLDSDRRRNLDGQLSFFDMGNLDEREYEPKLPNVEEFAVSDILAMEKEMTGMYLTGHPMAEFIGSKLERSCDRIADILESGNDKFANYRDGASVRLLAIISSVKTKITKNNTSMAFVTVEDMSGSIEMLVFPQTYSDCAKFIAEGTIIQAVGTISAKEDEEPKILCNQLVKADKNKLIKQDNRSSKNTNTNDIPNRKQNEAVKSQTEQSISDTPATALNSKPKHLYLRVKEKDCKSHIKAKQILAVFDGRVPVSFYYESTKEYEHLPLNYGTDINDVMINELKRQLGAENVVIK